MPASFEVPAANVSGCLALKGDEAAMNADMKTSVKRRKIRSV